MRQRQTYNFQFVWSYLQSMFIRNLSFIKKRAKIGESWRNVPLIFWIDIYRHNIYPPSSLNWSLIPLPRGEWVNISPSIYSEGVPHPPFLPPRCLDLFWGDRPSPTLLDFSGLTLIFVVLFFSILDNYIFNLSLLSRDNGSGKWEYIPCQYAEIP